MVIRLHYKWIAVFCAAALVIAVCIVEYSFPNTALTKSIVTGDEINDESGTAVDKADTVRLPVVMYHHILKDTARRGDYVVSPAQFESDLRYIQNDGYETVSASQIIDFLNGEGSLPSKPILITFDDGYETVHEYAFPLLKQYGMKAVIAVIGKHTDTFSKETEPHHLSYSHVSWEQLREMQKSGVFEIANHSYNMHEGRASARYGIGKKSSEDASAYRDAILNDIGGLNDEIFSEIGIKPDVFAYPFGSITKASFEVLQELDFKLLFTCEEKVNLLEGGTSLPAKLMRFNRAGGYETDDFFARLSEKRS